jgi:hypothetical protein
MSATIDNLVQRLNAKANLTMGQLSQDLTDAAIAIRTLEQDTRNAIRDERERCARIAEGWEGEGSKGRNHIAAAIRARISEGK